MKKTMLFTLFQVLPALFLAMTSPADEPPDFIKAQRENIQTLSSENNRLIAEDREQHVAKMIRNAETVSRIANDIRKLCAEYSVEDGHYALCHGYSRVFNETSVMMKMDIAKYCVHKGLRTTAKKLYHHIIRTYAEQPYRPYVTEAMLQLRELR